MNSSSNFQSLSSGASDVREELLELLQEGQRLEYLHDYAAAVEVYSRVIERDPENAVAYHRRGWAKAAMGDFFGEISDWNMALQIDPDFDAALADRAVAKVAAKDYTGAQADAARAIELNPALKDLLQPMLERLGEKIEQQLAAQKEAELSSVLEEIPVNKRREFLKNIILMGVATLAASLAGCGTKKLAGGKTNIRWAMIIDLKKCVGCKACTVACKVENHTPPGVAYNVVVEREVGVFPHTKREFIPRPCMHCEHSSCTYVCPVTATYTREDGIVVVDYDKCIGCKYCIAACPYGARSFDFGHNYRGDGTLGWENQPSPEYGQNRVREPHRSPEGNVRKCTFCLHRIYNGIAPACATTCMGHAIYFGNLADPNAKCMVHGVNLQDLLAKRNYMRLKEELGNEPRVYYLT